MKYFKDPGFKPNLDFINLSDPEHINVPRSCKRCGKKFSSKGNVCLRVTVDRHVFKSHYYYCNDYCFYNKASREGEEMKNKYSKYIETEREKEQLKRKKFFKKRHVKKRQ